MSHSTHRSFQGRFYGSDDPTKSVKALKDDGESTRGRFNTHTSSVELFS